jgi:hypothetical protein
MRPCGFNIRKASWSVRCFIEHVKQRFLTYDDIECGVWQRDPQNVAFNDAHILLQAY